MMLTALLSLLLLVVPNPPIVPLIDKVEKSLVRIEFYDEQGTTHVCTGFMVSPTWVLTSKHCVNDDTFVDGQASHVIKSNDMMAILSVPPLYKPVLEMRKVMPGVGEHVRVFGYGFGELFVFERMIAGVKDTDVALDGFVVPGMSGGPIVDSDGKVVGITQSLLNGVIGVGCGLDEIRNFFK